MRSTFIEQLLAVLVRLHPFAVVDALVPCPPRFHERRNVSPSNHNPCHQRDIHRDHRQPAEQAEDNQLATAGQMRLTMNEAFTGCRTSSVRPAGAGRR